MTSNVHHFFSKSKIPGNQLAIVIDFQQIFAIYKMELNLDDIRIKQLIWKALVDRGMYKGTTNPDIPIEYRYEYSKIMNMKRDTAQFLTVLGLWPEVNKIMAETEFPLTELPDYLQGEVLGRISPTAREFATVSKEWNKLADYALFRNIQEGRLVDPTVGIPNREMFFKLVKPGSESRGSLDILTNETRGEYFDPKPGLIDNIRTMRMNRWITGWTGLIYGTFPKSYLSDHDITDRPFERGSTRKAKLEILKTVPGTDYVKFVSLVEFDDYEAYRDNYQRQLANIEEDIAEIKSDDSLSDKQKRKQLRREEKRMKSVKFITHSVSLSSNLSEEASEFINDYRDRLKNMFAWRFFVRSSSEFVGSSKTDQEAIEILRKWKYPESGIVDLSSYIGRLELLISRADREKRWASTADYRVFPDYSPNSELLNVKPIEIIRPGGDSNPGWNIKMIPINPINIKNAGLIIPSLRDDVYVV